jgi:GTP-binding protein LepA
LQERRGVQQELSYIDEARLHLRYRIPLSELITDFNDSLKALTSGFATFDYEEAGYEESELVKVDVLINGKPVEALSAIAHQSKGVNYGKDLVQKLRKVVKRCGHHHRHTHTHTHNTHNTHTHTHTTYTLKG